MTREELMLELSRPYPAKYISKNQNNDYIKHSIVTQRLIHIFGIPPRVEVLREIYEGDVLSGVVMRMSVEGHPEFDVQEAGASDNPQSRTNGDRLKDACSDAYKRCAMRLGNTLHLWTGMEDYFLYESLAKKETNGND